ncbi:MAG TPA: DUF1698 domain-containing protein, partial [Blastocatellia bacterium]|nr:DUF1698 domain-containing protein [Blastocatellia bacterium]
MKAYPTAPKAIWPLRLSDDTPQSEVEMVRQRLNVLAEKSPYGWGHTMDFGVFDIQGILGEHYLQVAGLLDNWGWWPDSLEGLTVSDVGCFSGGLSALMASRGASKIYAIDEIPEHLAQCQALVELFQINEVECLNLSIYSMPQHIPPASQDIILFSGVLYHLSDMLVGLVALQSLLKDSGVL